MATALDVITSGARRIGILAAEEEFDSADATDALSLLNDMMHGFGPRGIGYAHTTLALTDTVNMPDELIESLKWMAADAFADEWGKEMSPRAQGRIIDAKNQLQAAYWVQPPADTEPALRPYWSGRFNITTGE